MDYFPPPFKSLSPLHPIFVVFGVLGSVCFPSSLFMVDSVSYRPDEKKYRVEIEIQLKRSGGKLFEKIKTRYEKLEGARMLGVYKT
jgi:hypothetical protein